MLPFRRLLNFVIIFYILFLGGCFNTKTPCWLRPWPTPPPSRPPAAAVRCLFRWIVAQRHIPSNRLSAEITVTRRRRN